MICRKAIIINKKSSESHDKWAGKEIRETLPFIIATNSIKYLEVT